MVPLLVGSVNFTEAPFLNGKGAFFDGSVMHLLLEELKERRDAPKEGMRRAERERGRAERGEKR